MDPLSITASTLTLITAAAAVVNILKSIKDSDEDLVNLLDDVTDFQQAVRGIQLLIHTHHNTLSGDDLSNLSKLLEQMEAKIAALQSIFETCTVRSERDGKWKASKIAWMKRKREISTLRSGLGQLTRRLNTFLITTTVSYSLRISGTVDEVRDITREIAYLSQRQLPLWDRSPPYLGRDPSERHKAVMPPTYVHISDKQRAMPLVQSAQLMADSQNPCARCTFVRSRGISNACLACARRITNGARLIRQPQAPLDLLRKRLLLPDAHVGYGYGYLEDIIKLWHEDTIPVFIKVLDQSGIPNLELRVRRFEPTAFFDAWARYRTFDDKLGWLLKVPVKTMPFAIPYTHYVESGRLELWARESYKWKFHRFQHQPGRSLIYAVGLEGLTVFHGHWLVKAAFTFAALTWVSTSVLYMSGKKTTDTCKHAVNQTIPSSPAFDEKVGPTAASYSDILSQDSEAPFQLCPSAINCQLTLLCLERARNIESDILSGLDRLLLASNPAKGSLDTLFLVYTTLTLLMDAYESWAMSFQHNHQILQRCIHLVECLASQTYLLTGSTMANFLEQRGASLAEGPLSLFAERLNGLVKDRETRAFFKWWSWEKAKSTNFEELNFAFQSFLQGIG